MDNTTLCPSGRFAPSPTGHLHFGSLLAALASYCDIKHRQGRWHLRIDDIDGPRSVAGSASAIQRTLEHYGLAWDGETIWQSQRMEYYHSALSTLVKQGLIFSCNCSRRSLIGQAVYPGFCRANTLPDEPHKARYSVEDRALRCRLSADLRLEDGIQADRQISLSTTVGDIIVWRRDGLVSYSLACAVDDATLVSDVVRGADLLESTAAQQGIISALGYPLPHYSHIPIAVDANNDKLSKHSQAAPVQDMKRIPTLLSAWRFLGQTDFTPESLNDFWATAPRLWQRKLVPTQRRLPL